MNQKAVSGRAVRTRSAGRSKTRAKRPETLDEKTVRAIRRTYRPGCRLRDMEERFETSGMTIISIVNRCTYTEYPTGDNEYEPAPHIRGTRRREQPAMVLMQERKPLPILRNDIRHLMPQAIRIIREAIDDGEPLGRIARCFGVTPESIAHMSPHRRKTTR